MSEHSNIWKGEICKRCFRRNCIGFDVENEIWSRVAKGYNVLCTTCFDELAQSVGISYSFIAVFPVSWSSWI